MKLRILTNQRAFSLLEVLFALLLVTIITAGLAPSFLHHLSSISDNEIRTGAISAAQVVLDDLRVQNVQGMPLSGSTTPETVDVGTKSYSVTTTYCSNASFCISNDTRHIAVQVNYNGEEIYNVETVYTSLR